MVPVVNISLKLGLILLKVGIAAFFGALSVTLASIVVDAIRGAPIPIETPFPIGYRITQLAMAVPTLLYLVSTIWLLRSAWQNLRSIKQRKE